MSRYTVIILDNETGDGVKRVVSKNEDLGWAICCAVKACQVVRDCVVVADFVIGIMDEIRGDRNSEETFPWRHKAACAMVAAAEEIKEGWDVNDVENDKRFSKGE